MQVLKKKSQKLNKQCEGETERRRIVMETEHRSKKSNIAHYW